MCVILKLSLGAFRKIEKSGCEIRHVCLSVCPPVRMEQFVPHWTDFHEI